MGFNYVLANAKSPTKPPFSMSMKLRGKLQDLEVGFETWFASNSQL